MLASGQYPLGCIHIRTEKQNFVKNQSEVALVCTGSNQHSLIGSNFWFLTKFCFFAFNVNASLYSYSTSARSLERKKYWRPKFDDRRQCNHAESSYWVRIVIMRRRRIDLASSCLLVKFQFPMRNHIVQSRCMLRDLTRVFILISIDTASHDIFYMMISLSS